MSNAGSYEDYLRSVREQEERDRDRFTGVDSHADKPLYSAETGPSIGDFIQVALTFEQRFNEFSEQMEAAARDMAESFTFLLRTGLRGSACCGSAPVTAHSYPRKHGQWWLRR